MTYQHLTLTKSGHIAWLTFNRPGKANALHYDHLLEIETAVLSLRDDPQTRVVVFTGAGKHFSSGAAMGRGACISSACDFRIGSDNCFMQYPEVDIGLNLMWKSLPLIIHLAGPARAKRLVIGGERIEAPELLNWGILDKQVPLANLYDAAEKMAQHYADKPPIAAQMIKRSTNQICNVLNGALMHMDADQNLLAASTDDRTVAVQAYLKKEKPTFKGS
ncbi:MAG: enoyl-CoA hydratase/isomerase family protein [Pseudomonadales bacterium]|jgi:enoyl-CoA hydratase/carnithine racemase|nr:enoyl-CoA hydratase/isomerase family protein [Pseudomonadales bacterium]